MKLTVEQIREITSGVVSVEENDGLISFHRFTLEQEKLYEAKSATMYAKMAAPSGVKLSFKTDSKKLFLSITTAACGSRTYFNLEVFVNGKILGYLKNFSFEEFDERHPDDKYSLGDFEGEFDLGDGEKDVCIVLPWSVITELNEISLDDGAFVEPIKSKKKLLAFGDSITQGFDALCSSNKYITKLADALGMEEINKGIGGERFFPALNAEKEPFEPDCITVAYGTNDWNRSDREVFERDCKEFYANLVRNYPNTKIFAITPIWRKDDQRTTNVGEFSYVDAYIKDVVKDFENVTVISGYDLVPHEDSMYVGVILHPNDKGFDHYFNNLYAKIKSLI